MHHIHGIHTQPAQVPSQAAPLPPGGKKPFSFLPELGEPDPAVDPASDPLRNDGPIDPDGRGRTRGAPEPEEREQAAAASEAQPEEAPAPPTRSFDIGIYGRTGAPRTPPPTAGGNCNTSM